MGAPTGIDVDALRAECKQLKKDKAQLKNTNLELKQSVCTFPINFTFN